MVVKILVGVVVFIIICYYSKHKKKKLTLKIRHEVLKSKGVFSNFSCESKKEQLF